MSFCNMMALLEAAKRQEWIFWLKTRTKDTISKFGVLDGVDTFDASKDARSRTYLDNKAEKSK